MSTLTIPEGWLRVRAPVVTLLSSCRLAFFNIIFGMPPGKLAVLQSDVCDTSWNFRERICSQHENF
jgi:hypothetical protein